MRKLFASMAFGCAALCLSGCSSPLAGIDTALSLSERDQAQRFGARPEVETGEDFETAVAETDIAVPLAAVSKWFSSLAASDFDSFLAGTAAVSGVQRSELLIGAWNKPGDRRRVVFADNNSAIEEILERSPQHFRYETWNLANDTGRYIHYAVGDFALSGNAQRTHIRWSYAFRPKRWPDGFFIRSFVQGDFRQFMGSALARMGAAAEGGRPRSR